jgi:hypothetical protein
VYSSPTGPAIHASMKLHRPQRPARDQRRGTAADRHQLPAPPAPRPRSDAGRPADPADPGLLALPHPRRPHRHPPGAIHRRNRHPGQRLRQHPAGTGRSGTRRGRARNRSHNERADPPAHHLRPAHAHRTHQLYPSAKPQAKTAPGPSGAAPTCTSSWPQPVTPHSTPTGIAKLAHAQSCAGPRRLGASTRVVELPPPGIEHELLLCLPAGHLRTVRLLLCREPCGVPAADPDEDQIEQTEGHG